MSYNLQVSGAVVPLSVNSTSLQIAAHGVSYSQQHTSNNGVPPISWSVVSSQSDHIETEGDRAAVETLGESPDVSQGAREGRTGGSAEKGEGAEERDGESEEVVEEP